MNIGLSFSIAHRCCWWQCVASVSLDVFWHQQHCLWNGNCRNPVGKDLNQSPQTFPWPFAKTGHVQQLQLPEGLAKVRACEGLDLQPRAWRGDSKVMTNNDLAGCQIQTSSLACGCKVQVQQHLLELEWFFHLVVESSKAASCLTETHCS